MRDKKLKKKKKKKKKKNTKKKKTQKKKKKIERGSNLVQLRAPLMKHFMFH